ncbi:hypothetical protein, partial [Shimia litoralis]|uniref:hypothetical protein n=1 Tax=Shimia litoralis TaxID=420403 RepID=UPI001BB0EAE5
MSIDPSSQPDPLIIRVGDIRASGICLQGARGWFRRQGLDWQMFLAQGLAAEVLAATGDALALRVIATAQAQVQSQAQTRARVRAKTSDESPHG